MPGRAVVDINGREDAYFQPPQGLACRPQTSIYLRLGWLCHFWEYKKHREPADSDLSRVVE